MNKISLEFTPQELDYIANVLAERPWKEANGLLSNIQQQVQSQQQQEKQDVFHDATARPASGNGSTTGRYASADAAIGAGGTGR
jgi:hypothetical protein